MSDATIPLKTELILDKRLAFSDERKFGVFKSGKNINNTFVTTQSYSNTNATFVSNPPSRQTALARNPLFQFTFTYTASGTAGSQGTLLNLYQGDAPRSWAIEKCCGSIQATIGDSVLTQVPYLAMQALERCNIDRDFLQKMAAFEPVYPDQWQNLDDNYTQARLLGVAKDPLQSDGNFGSDTPRGAWKLTSISNPNVGAGNPATASITFVLTCSLVSLSPFDTSAEGVSFIGINQFQVVFNFQNLFNLWSHSPMGGTNGVLSAPGTVTLSAPPVMMLTYIDPSDLQTIPKSNPYSYNPYVVYSLQAPSTAPGAQVTLTSSSTQMTQVPQRILIWMTEQYIDRNETTSDTNFWLNSLNITLGTQSGLLAGANAMQLWEISKESGSTTNWLQWSTTQGSVMILDFSKAIMSQSESEAPGISIQKQFQFTATFTNINPTRTIVPTLYWMVISNGLMTITDGHTQPQISVISPTDVLDVGSNTSMAKGFEVAKSWYGGKHIQQLKEFAHSMGKKGHKNEEGSGVPAFGGGLIGGAQAARGKHRLLMNNK